MWSSARLAATGETRDWTKGKSRDITSYLRDGTPLSTTWHTDIEPDTLDVSMYIDGMVVIRVSRGVSLDSCEDCSFGSKW